MIFAITVLSKQPFASLNITALTFLTSSLQNVILTLHLNHVCTRTTHCDLLVQQLWCYVRHPVFFLLFAVVPNENAYGLVACYY